MLILRAEGNHNVFPFTGQIDADTGYCLRFVLQTHRGQQETVMRHEVGDLSDVACHLHELSALQEVVVRMVNSHLKAQRLQQKYFVVLYPLLQLQVLRARDKPQTQVNQERTGQRQLSNVRRI